MNPSNTATLLIEPDFCGTLVTLESNVFFYLSTENVTVNDVKRVSSRMLASKPSVAALGNLANLPKFEEIERAFGNRGAFSGASRFFLFRNWWHGNPFRRCFNHAILNPCMFMYSYNEVKQFSLLGFKLGGNILKRQRNKLWTAFNFPTHALQNFTSTGEWPSLQALSSSQTLEIINKKRVALFSFSIIPYRPVGRQFVLVDSTHWKSFFWISKVDDRVVNILWPLWMKVANIARTDHK